MSIKPSVCCRDANHTLTQAQKVEEVQKAEEVRRAKEAHRAEEEHWAEMVQQVVSCTKHICHSEHGTYH